MKKEIRRSGAARPPTYNELRAALEAILWAEGGMEGVQLLQKVEEALVLLYGERL